MRLRILAVLLVFGCGDVVGSDQDAGASDAAATGFAITVDESALLVRPGESAEITVDVRDRPDPAAPVTVSIGGAPGDVTIEDLTVAANETTASLSISANANAAAGEFTITLSATSGGTTATADFGLAVSGPSGTLDLGFASNGIFRGDVDTIGRALARVDGGFILVGTSGGQVLVARLTDSGALDSTFGAGGVVETNLPDGGRGRAVAVDDAGNVIVAGASFDATGTSRMTLYRFGADGSVDTAFGNGGVSVFSGAGVSGELASIHIEASGDYLAADETTTAIVRFSAGGNTSSSLGIASPASEDFLGGTVFEADGRLVTVARSAAGNTVTARRTPDSFDATFVETTHAVTTLPHGLVKVPGGYMVGGIGSASIDLIRILDDGTPDPNFGINGARTNAAPFITPGGVSNNMAVDSLGRVLFGAKQRLTVGNLLVARFLGDGSLDPNFPGELVSDSGTGTIAAITFDDFGRIVVLGDADGQLIAGRLWP